MMVEPTISRYVVISLVLVLATLPACGHAAVLPSQITSDMTLSRANSPYEMRSQVTVAPGVELTVEAGVTLIARGDYRLTVSGSLQALASPDNRIAFRATDQQASGAWRGLYFTQGSVGRLGQCTSGPRRTTCSWTGLMCTSMAARFDWLHAMA